MVEVFSGDPLADIEGTELRFLEPQAAAREKICVRARRICVSGGCPLPFAFPYDKGARDRQDMYFWTTWMSI